jgi:hypothetical protein
MFAAATMADSTAAASAPASNDGSARAEPIDRDALCFADYVHNTVILSRPRSGRLEGWSAAAVALRDAGLQPAPQGDGEQKESS